MTIDHNLIHDNTNHGAIGGGGVFLDAGLVDFFNNTITQNFCNNGSGAGITLGYNIVPASLTCRNNIIHGNRTVFSWETREWWTPTMSLSGDYSCCPQELPGTGNITDDPCFADTSADDFRLLAGSPCLDAGDPASPLDPDSTRVDMGALYFDQTQGVTPGQAITPLTFTLDPAHPNPFNPATALGFRLPAPGWVVLKVHDTAGREVRTLLEGWRAAGSHEVTFEAAGLPSGVYLARLQAGEFTATMKLLLLK